MSKYKTLCIGIDQSYKNTGVSISCDEKILKIKSINLEKYKTNSERRKKLREYLANMVYKIRFKAEKVVCVFERIRLFSQGFINQDYIQSMGALNSVIVDVMTTFDIPVFSVDTRCWKSQVVGTTKPKSNEYGVPENKFPTIEFLIKMGYEKDILVCLGEERKIRKSKGVFVKKGHKWMYDNDAADSAAISLFYFCGDLNKLKPED